MYKIIEEIEQTISLRKKEPSKNSYVTELFEQGLIKIAQKVGEEGVETVIAALSETDERLVSEATDLFFHLLILLKEKNLSFDDIAKELDVRHKKYERV